MAMAVEGAGAGVVVSEPEVVSIPPTPRGMSTPEGTATPPPAAGRGAATPARRVVEGLRGYLEEVGHLTRLNPQDAWLPITESRSGNARYAAFHTLNAGLGFQALLLPLAFPALGWSGTFPLLASSVSSSSLLLALAISLSFFLSFSFRCELMQVF